MRYNLPPPRGKRVALPIRIVETWLAPITLNCRDLELTAPVAQGHGARTTIYYALRDFASGGPMLPGDSSPTEGADSANAESLSAAMHRQNWEIRAFIDHFPGVISRFDRQLRHLFVSRQIESRTGLKAEDFIGKTWRELGMQPELIDHWEPVVTQVFVSGQPADLKFSMPSPIGTVYYETRLFPDFGPDGTVETVFGMSRDITEETLAQRQLSESEERFRLAFEASPIGMVLSNDALKYIKANSAFCQMLGYTPEELTQLSPVDIIYPEDLLEGRDLSSRLVAGELSSYTRQKRYIAKDGGLVWTRSTVTVLRNAEGRPLFGLGMIEDISEQLEQRGRTGPVSRAIGRVAALADAKRWTNRKNRSAWRNGWPRSAHWPGESCTKSTIRSAPYCWAVETAQYGSDRRGREALSRSLKSIRDDAVRTGRIVKNVLSFVREQTVDKTPTSLNEVSEKRWNECVPPPKPEGQS